MLGFLCMAITVFSAIFLRTVNTSVYRPKTRRRSLVEPICCGSARSQPLPGYLGIQECFPKSLTALMISKVSSQVF